jgi:ankyrin repeat protein
MTSSLHGFTKDRLIDRTRSKNLDEVLRLLNTRLFASEDVTDGLFHAISRDATAIAKLLLESKANVNRCSILDDTPLMRSASLYRTSMVKLLVEHGADVNLCNSRGRTALHVTENHEIIKCLVDHGAAPSLFVIDDCGETPLLRSSKKPTKHVFCCAMEKYGCAPCTPFV